MNLFDNWASISIVMLLPLFIQWLDLIAKSVVVAGLVLFLCRQRNIRHSSTLKHSLWFQALIGISLLPLLIALFGQLESRVFSSSTLFTLYVSTEDTKDDGLLGVNSVSNIPLWLTLYFSFLTVLLLRVIHGFLRIKTIGSKAEPASDAEILELMNSIKSRLGVSSSLHLRYSNEVSSPFSFGFRKPTVILPVSAEAWPRNMLEDVLIHEISHIARRDWVSMTVSRLLTCIYWFNPLCWLAMSKINEEAENCCDSAVLTYGKSNAEYAENLVSIAREGKNDSLFLAQMLANKSKFHRRIRSILEGNMTTLVSRPTRSIFTALIILTVAFGVGVQVIAADAERSELYATSTPIPYYPSQAADEGVEGWVLLQFTVEASGGVDPTSITVSDESPAGVFTQSAISAAESFTFEPRYDNGVAVAVPGVQYVFRYVLQE